MNWFINRICNVKSYNKMKINGFEFGEYQIIVDGDQEYQNDREKYIINEDLSLKWSWNGTEKLGFWTYEEGLFEMYIEGNTGEIFERYKFDNGKWINAEFPERTLVKRNI